MVAQLAMILGLGMFLALGCLFYLLHCALRDMRSLVEQALLTSKASSAKDLAEAKEYSADAAMSREFAREQTGPSIATLDPATPIYTTPDGVEHSRRRRT